MSEYRSSVQYAGVADVHGLLAALKATDARDRQHARELLIAVGRPAVGPLVRLLDDPDHRVRWEAVKTLAAIGDPAAAPALIDALEDDAADVRWVAAQALIDLGHEALAAAAERRWRTEPARRNCWKGRTTCSAGCIGGIRPSWSSPC